MKKLTTLLAVTIGVAAIAPAATASAEPLVVTGQAPLTKIVSYADLDLSTATGRKVLGERVYRAATRLCDADVMRPLRVKQYHDQCRRQALSAAQPQIRDAIQWQHRRPDALAALTLVRR